eukprot:TRINITY_DN642_c0_g1_i6.p3 TRINITY_DN642_c0_g1~~TRINITY_DN642_c0_g1_i6.p3  ORF type:complete len:122 (-),score=7.81 TRINITY_DN642_c0_g1_i6:42-407(-)
MLRCLYSQKKCADVDGAYFGCSFPHILLQSYQELYPAPPNSVYIPRIYGFKIHTKKGSKFYEEPKNVTEITFYGEEQLKKLKANLLQNQNAGGLEGDLLNENGNSDDEINKALGKKDNIQF